MHRVDLLGGDIAQVREIFQNGARAGQIPAFVVSCRVPESGAADRAAAMEECLVYGHHNHHFGLAPVAFEPLPQVIAAGDDAMSVEAHEDIVTGEQEQQTDPGILSEMPQRGNSVIVVPLRPRDCFVIENFDFAGLVPARRYADFLAIARACTEEACGSKIADVVRVQKRRPGSCSGMGQLTSDISASV